MICSSNVATTQCDIVVSNKIMILNMEKVNVNRSVDKSTVLYCNGISHILNILFYIRVDVPKQIFIEDKMYWIAANEKNT